MKNPHIGNYWKKYIPCYRNQTIPCDWIPQELSAGSVKKRKEGREKERKKFRKKFSFIQFTLHFFSLQLASEYAILFSEWFKKVKKKKTKTLPGLLNPTVPRTQKIHLITLHCNKRFQLYRGICSLSWFPQRLTKYRPTREHFHYLFFSRQR